MVARKLPALPTVATLRVKSRLVVTSRGQQSDKAAGNRLQVITQSIFRIQIHLRRLAGLQIVEVHDGDTRGQKPRVGGRKGGRHVKSGIIERPLKAFGPDAQIAENSHLLAIGEAMKNHNGTNFLVERVVQAFCVRCDHPFLVVRDLETFDPVAVGRQPRDLIVLHTDFVQAHRRLVIRVVHHFRVVFLLFHFLFVQRRIFFRAVNNRVFIEPLDAPRRARQLRQRPRFASIRIDHTD